MNWLSISTKKVLSISTNNVLSISTNKVLSMSTNKVLSIFTNKVLSSDPQTKCCHQIHKLPSGSLSKAPLQKVFVIVGLFCSLIGLVSSLIGLFCSPQAPCQRHKCKRGLKCYKKSTMSSRNPGRPL